MRIQYQLPEGKQQVDFRLPVYLNKFNEPVDMPLDSFNKYWSDITHNRPATFQKVDHIFKNPAPSNVPISEVMKKIHYFMTQSLNLKVVDQENENLLKAVGEMSFKPAD